ncbi:hypothetical protein CONPUDRAFT_166474 [Coniophora puteana RWD-64-598 SS2]|uniref:DUF6534 domain-containing protein n=1 Tax=Coniophora puteana (strain RWD-64-598) TaxID=741705 RepID=A0A5M3ML01_CONPW|nr:uncharacterized protein CONPUDRAFT_166474 [Coniophora puteana RWD-64-598 SS2]EIW79763.1 hypothetical protein CONPUDRAFT_166474 [Coniophora puteana RWD-64-598 SS2]
MVSKRVTFEATTNIAAEPSHGLLTACISLCSRDAAWGQGRLRSIQKHPNGAHSKVLVNLLLNVVFLTTEQAKPSGGPTSLLSFELTVVNMGEHDASLGTLFIGIVFNTWLFGLVTYQFCSYWSSNMKDTRVFSILLVTVFITDAAASAMMIYVAWFLLIEGYNQPITESIYAKFWPLHINPMSIGWSAFVTQMYLIRRFHRLASKRLLAIALAVLATSCLGLSIGFTVRSFTTQLHLQQSQVPSIAPQATSWLILTCITDCFVTGFLGVALLRLRTGIERTDHIIYRTLRGAVQTGVFAGIFTLGSTIFTFVWPTSFMELTFAIPAGNVYTITLFYSVLLRRESVEHRAGDGRGMELPTSRAMQLTSVISIDQGAVFKQSTVVRENTTIPNA